MASSYKPEFPYLGDHLILNSGRVTINSKDDSIMLFAKESISFSSAGTIHFNSDEELIINSPRIYLGLETDINKPEPAIRGEKLYDLLNVLIDALINLGEGLSYAQDSNGIGIPSVSVPGESLVTDTLQLQTLIEKIKSEKTFLL
jgi:hypothetical protein